MGPIIKRVIFVVLVCCALGVWNVQTMTWPWLSSAPASPSRESSQATTVKPTLRRLT